MMALIKVALSFDILCLAYVNKNFFKALKLMKMNQYFGKL